MDIKAGHDIEIMPPHGVEHDNDIPMHLAQHRHRQRIVVYMVVRPMRGLKVEVQVPHQGVGESNRVVVMAMVMIVVVRDLHPMIIVLELERRKCWKICMVDFVEYGYENGFGCRGVASS